jgi:uncharacterized Zn-finger protein
MFPGQLRPANLRPALGDLAGRGSSHGCRRVAGPGLVGGDDEDPLARLSTTRALQLGTAEAEQIVRQRANPLVCQGSGRSPVRWPLVFLVGGQQNSVLVVR